MMVELLWLLGYAADVLVVQQLAVVAMLPTVILIVCGLEIFKQLLFPLTFLIFAVPMGDNLVPHLQDFTASFTVKALQLTGIPVYWEGVYFSIPSGDFEVAQACSGIRYLIASVVLGCLYAYLTYQSFIRRAVFILVSLIVPIIANGIRAYGIVMIAHLTEMKYAVGFDHFIYGWLFFGLVMFILFWIGSFFREEETVNGKPRLIDGKPPELTAIEEKKRASHLVVAIGVAVILLSGIMSARAVDYFDENTKKSEIVLPKGKEPWAGPMQAEGDWMPIYPGATEKFNGTYEKNSKKVFVYVVYYQRETQGAELINYKNQTVDGKKWRLTAKNTQYIKVNSQHQFSVVESVIVSREKKRLVWQWYNVSGYRVTDTWAAKVYKAISRLSGNGNRSVAIFISAEYLLQEDEARRVLQEFLESMQQGLQFLE